MWEDPVVKEVRSAGAKLLEACGGDLRKLAEQLRINQSKHPEKIVDKRRMAHVTGRKSS